MWWCSTKIFQYWTYSNLSSPRVSIQLLLYWKRKIWKFIINTNHVVFCIKIESEYIENRIKRFFSPVFSDVSISDISVAIYVSGPHRRDVLDAVSFLIEQLKANVPIWKKVTFSSFFLFIRFLPHHIYRDD